jgi:hypothetical protein
MGRVAHQSDASFDELVRDVFGDRCADHGAPIDAVEDGIAPRRGEFRACFADKSLER